MPGLALPRAVANCDALLTATLVLAPAGAMAARQATTQGSVERLTISARRIGWKRRRCETISPGNFRPLAYAAVGIATLLVSGAHCMGREAY